MASWKTMSSTKKWNCAKLRISSPFRVRRLSRVPWPKEWLKATKPNCKLILYFWVLNEWNCLLLNLNFPSQGSLDRTDGAETRPDDDGHQPAVGGASNGDEPQDERGASFRGAHRFGSRRFATRSVRIVRSRPWSSRRQAETGPEGNQRSDGNHPKDHGHRDHRSRTQRPNPRTCRPGTSGKLFIYLTFLFKNNNF